MQAELNKYFLNTHPAEMMRSEIRPDPDNPRTITEEGKRQLKRSVKKYGVVGGLVVNEQTGFTVVGGNQKIAILDSLNHYDPNKPETDYRLRVEVGNWDVKTEKQLNIILNNPNVGGQWDIDKLASIVPDIDYKDAGLTEADLNMIGCDYLLKTEEENNLAGALSSLTQPLVDEREAEKAARRAAAEVSAEDLSTDEGDDDEADEELSYDERKQRTKDLKAQVREQAQQKADDMEAYVMLSFDNYKAKAAFMQRFGYDPQMKILKGEVFQDQVERID